MDAVVADLDGDLSVGQVGSDEGGLDFDMGLFPGVQDVSAGGRAAGVKIQVACLSLCTLIDHLIRYTCSAACQCKYLIS